MGDAKAAARAWHTGAPADVWWTSEGRQGRGQRGFSEAGLGGAQGSGRGVRGQVEPDAKGHTLCDLLTEGSRVVRSGDGK